MTVHNFLIVLSHGYLECTSVPWISHIVYRRTVGFERVVWC